LLAVGRGSGSSTDSQDKNQQNSIVISGLTERGINVAIEE